MGKTKTVIIGETPEEKVIEPKKETHKEKYEKLQKAKKVVEESRVETSDSEKSELPEDSKTEKEEIAKSEEVIKKPSKSVSKKRARFSRGKKYIKNKGLITKKLYSVEDAIELVKKTSYAKFDATVEIHITTVAKKGQDPLRGLIKLPSGAVKAKKVEIASEELIEKIKKGIIEFDILLAKPEMMANLAKVAKILGPKGLMPNPKSGTVTEDAELTKKELSAGKVEYKSDAQNNIHLAVGKVSWENEKIQTNIDTLIKGLPDNRIAKIYLSTTMGPSVRVR